MSSEKYCGKTTYLSHPLLVRLLLTPFFLRRIIIDTPEKYAKLRNGQIGSFFNIVTVKSGAHPQVLEQPKFFGNAIYFRMNFIDEHNNKITLKPRRYGKTTEASFTTGVHTLHGLPTNHKVYSIRFINNSNATVDSVQAIIQWKRAKEIKIVDDCDIVTNVLKIVNQFSESNSLERLTLKLYHKTHKQFNVTPFLTELSSLKIFYLDAKSLTLEEYYGFCI